MIQGRTGTFVNNAAHAVTDWSRVRYVSHETRQESLRLLCFREEMTVFSVRQRKSWTLSQEAAPESVQADRCPLVRGVHTLKERGRDWTMELHHPI